MSDERPNNEWIYGWFTVFHVFRKKFCVCVDFVCWFSVPKMKSVWRRVYICIFNRITWRRIIVTQCLYHMILMMRSVLEALTLHAILLEESVHCALHIVYIYIGNKFYKNSCQQNSPGSSECQNWENTLILQPQHSLKFDILSNFSWNIQPIRFWHLIMVNTKFALRNDSYGDAVSVCIVVIKKK